MPRRNAAVQFRKPRYASKRRPKSPQRSLERDMLARQFDLYE